MKLKFDNTDLGLFTSSVDSKESKPKIKIIYFTSSYCLEKHLTDKDFIYLLESKYKLKEKFDFEIVIYFINSENQRLDSDSINKLNSKKLDYTLKQVKNDSSELKDIKSTLEKKLRKKIENIQCSQISLFVEFNGKEKLVHRGDITFAKDLHGLLNDLYLYPEIYKESIVLSFKNFSKIFHFN